ncbi:hypothetical protein ACLKA6_004331 [Drosophila palustris]
MRVPNRHAANPGYRAINGNKKVVAVQHLAAASRNRRWAQTTTVKNQTRRNLSPHVEEYDDADVYSDVNDDASDSEPEYVEEQKRAFKTVASKVRPLLQLFADSEEPERKPTTVVERTKTPAIVHQQILYKDISLCSEEESEATSEFQEEDPNVFLDRRAINSLHQETKTLVTPKLNSKRFEWTPKSTNVFLELWEKNLKGIRGKRKNSLIHKEMAQEMSEYGLTHREIKAKIDNMTKKHRTEAEKIKMGKGTHWRYYNRVRALLTGPLPDFEEILIDNTDTSTYFEADNSEADSESNDMSEEDDIQNETIKKVEVNEHLYKTLMAKTEKQAMFVINVQEEEAKCTESQLDILLKIHDGQYRLVKKNRRSSVWNVYREIARPDGSKLKWRYYCLGCKRVMQSTGKTTSNLRIHKCHVRYIKQHGRDVESQEPPQRSHNHIQRLPTTASKRQSQHFEEYYHPKSNQCSDVEEDYEEEADVSATTNPEIEHLELPEETSLIPNERPLLKLFSEEESWSPDLTEVQPIDLDHVTEEETQDFSKETIKPSSEQSIHIDATAISEAESYAHAWAHAFLKLSEDQKFYAKRSIDELLVLGRLERLNISTVTSLTTNL